MELFTVNRYDVDKDTNQTNEDEILQKLLKKVEKRKRKHSETKKKEPKTVVSDNTPKEEHDDVALVAVGDPLIGETIDDIDLIGGDNGVEDEAIPHKFEVLGEDSDQKKRQKVNVVLPAWLAHPNIISTSVAPTAESIDENLLQSKFLSPQIRGALKEMKISRLFPVQTAAIPWILEAHAKPPPFRPRDVCVSAPTGSGKTLAFAIPVVQILAQRTERKIRALVILPVAELALQVFRVFKKLCEKTDLNVCLLSNQTPLPVEREKLVELYKGRWYSKVDIVVSTPGRLVDHLHGTEGFCLKSLKFLVIDEADRIMDAVFQNWLYHLHAHVRATSDQLLSGQAAPLCYNELELAFGCQPHKLLFSATLSQDPEKLQNLRLFQPILFTSVLANLEELQDKYAAHAESLSKSVESRGEFIGKYTTPAELTEKFCLTETRLKPLTLYSLIKENKWKKFLCFTNSVESSGRLAFVLQNMFESDDDYEVEELSGNQSAAERSAALSLFARGKTNGLVCSDALARGIDVPEVDIVISYDPPRHIKTYIHRIGRTARAGRPGTAITMLSHNEQQTFDKLLREVGKVITEEQVASTATEEVNAKKYQIVLEELRSKILKDKHTKILQKQRAKEKSEISTKDMTTMTLMEKLQMQATVEVHDKVKQELEPCLSGKKNQSKKFKPKKLKPSKEKSQKTIPEESGNKNNKFKKISSKQPNVQKQKQT